MLNSYRVVLFDLDGTLVNHSDAARDGVIAWSHDLGIPADPARWLDLEQRWFLAFEQGKATHLGQRVARVREYLCEPKLSDTAALVHFTEFLTHYIAAMQPFPHAADVIEQCFDCGQSVGIATNGATSLQTMKLRATGLWDDRLTMVAAAEVGVAKPNPEFYVHALHAMQASPTETVMIGDSLANDVLCPIASGIAAIHVNRGNHDDSVGNRSRAASQRTGHPVYPTIRDLSELLTVP